MTAGVLAGELGLPLLVVQLHALNTKFTGETAAKLRLVFDAMEWSACVTLFDEFDATRAERAALNDVGEIRRILNSFLQFLEQDSSPGGPAGLRTTGASTRQNPGRTTRRRPSEAGAAYPGARPQPSAGRNRAAGTVRTPSSTKSRVPVLVTW